MLQVIAGGQYGSEAKGHVAAILARETPDLAMAIRVGGPNAGHTVYDEDTGRPIALRQIPVAAVARPGTVVAIGSGSEIDPEVLGTEMDLISIGWGLNLMVDPQATMMAALDATQEQHEQLTERLGSTSKGIGVARQRRLARTATLAGDHYGVSEPVAERARRYLDGGNSVQLEGSQGYGLGLHAGYYPYCTSDDCRVVDIVARAGLSPFDDLEAWLVFRTFPIRVAGNSGPLSGELTWDAFPGIEPERTTVTQKIRRIGQWDPDLFAKSLSGNGATPNACERGDVRIALTFADYIDPDIADTENWDTLTTSERLMEWIWHNIEAPAGVPPALICTGPRTHVWWGGKSGGHAAFSGHSGGISRRRGWGYHNLNAISSRDFFDDGRP